VLTARTLKEGEGRVEQPRTDRVGGPVEVEGSLETTAAAVEEAGQRALVIPMDLLSRDSIDQMVDHALSEWGRVDLLLNNAVWSGQGLLDPIRTLDFEALEKALLANAVNQLYLTKKVLEPMLERRQGQIFNMTSSAGLVDAPPYKLVEMGMLGFAHCASKGAFHRIAPLLHAEHAKDGIRAINLDPGFTRSEAMDALGLPTLGAATSNVTGEVIAWLASHPEEDRWDGRTVDTLELCAELGLVAGWPPPPA
jgi:NAD(P)-dependent dehydrogenase (short-subunit alcohol dehydrogenase family)